jgi:hypothetical protein
VTDDLRPDVLADLTRPRGLSTDQGDALLDATPAEREAASRLLLARTKDMLEQAGVLPAQRTVLDLDFGRVMTLAAAFGVTLRWWDQPGWRDRTLGDLVKVLPADAAAQVHQYLVAGGWLRSIPPEAPDQ